MNDNEGLTKKEWEKEVKGHTPGPWKVEYGGFGEKMITTRRQYIRYCRKVWDLTKASGNMQKEFHVVFAKNENNEEVTVAIVGNGPKSAKNALLIAGAPNMFVEITNDKV